MLNPVFSKAADLKYGSKYVLPDHLKKHVASANQSFDSGPELRLQEVFTKEIWEKLRSLGIKKSDLESKDILDICSGTGYLSFHLLERIEKCSVTLTDISPVEINMAKKLLSDKKSVKFCIDDATNMAFADQQFDVVIGNSFLHHYYDLESGLKEILRVLKPGGIFISLHEPKILAIPLEKASPKEYLKALVKPVKYLDSIRYNGDGEVVKESGTDVWIFNSKEIKQSFKNAGYLSIKVANWNIFRPYKVQKHNLHLSNTQKKLSVKQARTLERSIYADKVLSTILPPRFFGSFAIIGYKKK